MKKILLGLFVFVSVLGFSHLASADVIYSQPFIGGNVHLNYGYYVGGFLGKSGNSIAVPFQINPFHIPADFTTIRVKKMSEFSSCPGSLNLDKYNSEDTVYLEGVSDNGEYCDFTAIGDFADKGVAGDYIRIWLSGGSGSNGALLEGSSNNDGESKPSCDGPEENTYIAKNCTFYKGGFAFLVYNTNLDINPNYPNVSNKFLASPSCTDGIQNQDETGIDIGGVCGLGIVFGCRDVNATNFNMDATEDTVPTSCVYHTLIYTGNSCQWSPVQIYDDYLVPAYDDTHIYVHSGMAVFNLVSTTTNICRIFTDTSNGNNQGMRDVSGLENGTYYFLNSSYDSSTQISSVYALFFTMLNGVITSSSSTLSATCSDGIQNQDETGIDTGGVCQKLTHNPVLIIPGVLGNDINKPTDNGLEKLWLNLTKNFTDFGDQFMDPLQFNLDLTPSDMSLIIGDVIKKETVTAEDVEIKLFDYTDSLIKEFQNQGYTEGTDLFLFPYDWRYGVSDSNINKLKQKIEDIKTQTGSDKVDIIAHSTGGLLAKKYIVDNQTNNYIDKAIFVGVPNTGAPATINTILNGSNFGNLFLNPLEMKKIAQNMPVIYDLSPSEEYYNNKGSYVKVVDKNSILNVTNSKDLNFSETNDFLISDHKLNSQAMTNANNLHTAQFDNFDLRTLGVDLYAIDGCKTGTIGKIIENRIYDTTSEEPALSYNRLELVPGDGSIPLESATNLPINQGNKYYALKSDHSEMLGQNGIKQKIISILSGNDVTISDKLITQDISSCNLNGKAISIFSPVDIDIVDNQGNHSGLINGAIQNDIPNASFEIMGDHKFVYLPDDEGQTYTINLKGTDSGTFTLNNEDISNNEVTQTEVFSNIPVTTSLTGQVNLGSTTTLSLDNNGDGTTDQTIQPSSIINSDQSQDLISPVSTPIITGLMGQPGFYRSNVNINIKAVDPVITGQELETSGILKINYNLDNTGYQTYSTPINISVEGQHTIKFFSTDKAGNNEMEQSINFTVDKTPPELQATFDINTKDVVLSVQDILDQNPTILTNKISTTLTDMSGNITAIPFTKYKDLPTRLRFTYNQITRNGITTKIPDTNVFYDWQEKKGNLTDLDTKVTVKGVEKYMFSYKKATNITTIKVKMGSKIITTTRSGFVFVTVKTDGDSLVVSY